MKRKFLAAAALGGSFLVAPLTAGGSASAAPLATPLRAVSTVAPSASGSPPKVVAVARPSLPRWTVRPGNTLSGIGQATGRSWTAIWAYNRSVVGSNPNLIYVGQVFTVPPASYAGSVSIPAPAPRYTPPAPRHTYTSTRTYTPRRTSSVSRSYVAPTHTYVAPASGGFKACVEFRESTNGRGSSNLYGILNSTWSSLGRGGSAYTASPAEQSAAFDQLYAKDGASPWAPYDGC